MANGLVAKMTATAQRAVENVEQAKVLDTVAQPVAKFVGKVTGGKRVKNLLSGTWLGHSLHPVLTDLPIGMWTAATLLDVTAGAKGRTAARRLVGLGTLAAVPTALAGAADWSDTYGPTQRVGLVHAAGNDLAVTLQAVSWLARRRGAHGWGVLLSLAAFGCTIGSAYLGGHLSFSRGVGVNHTAFEEPQEGEWFDVAAEADLADGTPLRVTAGDVAVVLVKQRERVFALSATCTHAGGPLDEGEITDDGCVVCPWHGSRFHLDDGSIDRGPATTPEPAWQVRVADGRVAVLMPER